MENYGKCIYEDALKYCERALFSESGKDALEFLKTNYELTDEIIKEYRLGFSKNLEELSTYMQEIGYSRDELKKYSLLFDNERSNSTVTFGNRIIYPYRDELGNIAALGGRKIDMYGEGAHYQTLSSISVPMFFGLYEAIKNEQKRVALHDIPLQVPRRLATNQGYGISLRGMVITREYAEIIAKYFNKIDIVANDGQIKSSNELLRHTEKLLKDVGLITRIIDFN
jgi:DNA primase